MQKGGREKSRPVFLGENRDSLAASKSPPFENREGRGIPLLKHDLLQQFRTDDFAYLLAFFCDLLSLLFAAHDLVTHRFAFGGQAVHGSGLNSEQSNSPDGALGVVLLRCRRSYEQQKTSQGPVYFGHVSFSSDVKWIELKKRGHDTCLSGNLKAGCTRRARRY